MASQLSPSITRIGTAADPLPKKRDPGIRRGRQYEIDRLLPVQPVHGIHQRRHVTRGFAPAASGQHCYLMDGPRPACVSEKTPPV